MQGWWVSQGKKTGTDKRKNEDQEVFALKVKLKKPIYPSPFLYLGCLVPLQIPRGPCGWSCSTDLWCPTIIVDVFKAPSLLFPQSSPPFLILNIPSGQSYVLMSLIIILWLLNLQLPFPEGLALSRALCPMLMPLTLLYLETFSTQHTQKHTYGWHLLSYKMAHKCPLTEAINWGSP